MFLNVEIFKKVQIVKICEGEYSLRMRISKFNWVFTWNFKEKKLKETISWSVGCNMD
jgi:hypothetical protein